MHQKGLFQCPVCKVKADRLGAIILDFEQICWNETRSAELMQTLEYYPVLKAESVNDFSYDIKLILVYFIEKLSKNSTLGEKLNLSNSSLSNVVMAINSNLNLNDVNMRILKRL